MNNNDNRQFQDQRSMNISLHTDLLNATNTVNRQLIAPEPLSIMSSGQIEELMDFEDEPQPSRVPLQIAGPVVTSPILYDPQQMEEYKKVQDKRQAIASLASFQRGLAQESRSADQKVKNLKIEEDRLYKAAMESRSGDQRLRNLANASRSNDQQLKNANQVAKAAAKKLRDAAQASRSELQKMRNLAQSSRSEAQRVKNLAVHSYDSPLLARGSLSPSSVIEAPPAPSRIPKRKMPKLMTVVTDPGWLAQGLDDRLPFAAASKRRGRDAADDLTKKRKNKN